MNTQTFVAGSRMAGARCVMPKRQTVTQRRAAVAVRATAAEKEMVDDMGFKLMRRGVKVAAKETILTPR